MERLKAEISPLRFATVEMTEKFEQQHCIIRNSHYLCGAERHNR